jgi:hypothetical protein
VTNLNGVQPVVDLGVIAQRQREKERVPTYSLGSPEFAMTVGIPVFDGLLSFRDALDRAAVMLGNDGFTIEEVKQCAFAGQGQQGEAIFQVIVRVSETEPQL